METIKQIKQEKRSLKDLKLKVVDLEVENGESDFDFLTDDLTEILKEKLEERKLKYFDDLKVFYSLCCCQGDGFMFEGTIKTDKISFDIKQSGHYYHYNSKEINVNNLIEKRKEIYSDEYTKRQEDKENKLLIEFEEVYKDICREMELKGYELIENQAEQDILRSGFNNFLEENDLISEYEIFDLDYKTKEEKGFIKICDSGNTNIELWIKNQEVDIKTFFKASANITEYTEKTI